ncbi:MAG: hypothetical protein K2Y21_03730 [Phycisphaerales bacterium]|nr:hypothetical protein [Phycisphaerales bacterium]
MISINAKGRERLIWTAALLAPLVAVQVARFFEVETVRSAAAAGVVDTPAPAVRPVARPSAAQQRALDWLRERDFSKVIDPFASAVVARGPVNEIHIQPLAVAEPEPPAELREPIPTLELTGVMDGRRGPLASINRKIWRLGDEVVPGWTLEAVDARRKVVTVRSTLGNALELTVKNVPPTP